MSNQNARTLEPQQDEERDQQNKPEESPQDETTESTTKAAKDSKCSAIVEKTGKACVLTASYCYLGKNYCGTHVKKFKLPDQESFRIPSSPKKKVPGLTEEMFYLNIYNAIIERILENNIPEGMNEESLSLIQNTRDDSNFKKLSICAEACRNSGTKENLQTIIRFLPETIKRYEEAENEKKENSSLDKRQYDYMEEVIGRKPNYEIIYRTQSSDTFISEDGYSVLFSDCNICLLNCNSLRRTGEHLGTWIRKNNNIYMGPSLAVVDNDGNESPEENSSWYIPLRETFRKRQNIKDAKDILEKLKNGEDKSRYLSLKGKTLGGVCLPYPCHTEVYIMVVLAIMYKVV
jgi:hypothetical protein